MWTTFKVFTEFVTILFLSYLLFFGHQACEILATSSAIKLKSSILEGEVLYMDKQFYFMEF